MKHRANSELKAVWKSLEIEVMDDIRRGRTEQLHYRLNLIITEMIMFGVPRVNAESFVIEKMERHNIKFIPVKPKRGFSGKRVLAS